MKKWYVEVYENEIPMSINYFDTKQEAMDFIESNGLEFFEMGNEECVCITLEMLAGLYDEELDEDEMYDEEYITYDEIF